MTNKYEQEREQIRHLKKQGKFKFKFRINFNSINFIQISFN